MIEPPPKSTVYYFVEYQPVFDEYPQIDFRQGVPTVRELEEACDTLIVYDDMMMESNDALLYVFTRGSHHQRNSVIHIMQNLFNSNKNTRTMSLNAQYLVCLTQQSICALGEANCFAQQSLRGGSL